MIVIDAFAMVMLLTDGGPTGQWVAQTVSGEALSAPSLMPFEVSNILRRQQLSGTIDATAATLAHSDLNDMPIDLYPYTAGSTRTWELRTNLTCYDASYVALAELLNAPLVTIDFRLAKANGPRCPILVPDQP